MTYKASSEAALPPSVLAALRAQGALEADATDEASPLERAAGDDASRRTVATRDGWGVRRSFAWTFWGYLGVVAVLAVGRAVLG